MIDSLSMAPRKDHAKSRKNDLRYDTNSLNILLYDVFWVKINVYSKTSVYLWYFCYSTQIKIKVKTKLPNSEQSYKGKVKTHNYINRQNQSTTGKLWKSYWPWLGTGISKEMVGWIRF